MTAETFIWCVIAICGLVVIIAGTVAATKLFQHGYGTCCYCPDCGTELVGDTSTKVTHDSSGMVEYVCSCGTRSLWDFDLPVPMLVRYWSKSYLERVSGR